MDMVRCIWNKDVRSFTALASKLDLTIDWEPENKDGKRIVSIMSPSGIEKFFVLVNNGGVFNFKSVYWEFECTDDPEMKFRIYNDLI